jgi:uroporphyrin-III C-methyltransferase/precorrin-2 dehydrogenase/sirohydrochlorin ferrochelatase
MAQSEINQLIIDHVGRGAQVVRLKSGDPSVFGRLDEELEAIATHDISHSIVPGITAASAAAASLGRSLTQRGRNSSVRLITGHHMAGFADHDWGSMAEPDVVAAIYMGKKAARFIQGRLMMHGADPETPISVVENVSRPDQRTISTQLKLLPHAVRDLTGPAVLLYGIYPRTKSIKIILEQVFEI